MRTHTISQALFVSTLASFAGLAATGCDPADIYDHIDDLKDDSDGDSKDKSDICFSTEECEGEAICSVDLGECDSLCDDDSEACDSVCVGNCVEVDEEPESADHCVSSEQCAKGLVCSTRLGECSAPPYCDVDGPCPAVCTGSCIEPVPVEPAKICMSSGGCALDEICSVELGDCNSCDKDEPCLTVCTGVCLGAGASI